MINEIDIRPALRALLQSQRFAVLATDDHGQPFTSLMAFATTEDLRHLVVLTEQTTRSNANDHTACTLAVYASQRWLPDATVRLPSGGWPTLSARG